MLFLWELYSVDDHAVSYQSLKMNGSSSEERRNTEMLPSPDALEAQRLQKMYNMFRKQASGASPESPLGKMSPQHQRLENWIQELESKHRNEKKYGYTQQPNFYKMIQFCFFNSIWVYDQP